ncbi:hypothetical protein [Prochlorococcus marinus]|uniref:hypothetical protein n=1 Tax=Prochlorococcus TaxID=1218 RepID=UPI001F3DB292|nr:hypothetical protein [Prochlorococcus marinus]
MQEWQAKAQIASENPDNQFLIQQTMPLKLTTVTFVAWILKKQLGVLLYRRERMERELEAIKAALSTLEDQMQRNVAYEQLSICDKSSP